LEERGKTVVAVPQWNILPGERATVALILSLRGQDVFGWLRTTGDGACTLPARPERLAAGRLAGSRDLL